jgi:MFS family permease
LNRWTILAVLFLARVSMAFQFQAVAALSPEIGARLGLSLSQIGLLIGLYLIPGVVVAIPGGALAARIGEKRIVTLGMLGMLCGGALAALWPRWEALLVGRVIAGIGGVVLNVVMTKLVIDWFANREASTAMAIYINSWPIGIALALVSLPLAVAAGGLPLARFVELGAITVTLVLFVALYRAAPGGGTVTPGATPTGRERRARLPVLALTLAALVWAFYNAALSMVFSFAPAFLSERGADLSAAGTLTGVFMILLAVSLPLGGAVADRSGRRDLVITVSLLAFAGLVPMMVSGIGGGLLPILLISGFIFGLAGGPIMTLTAPILRPEQRSLGMGVLWAIYYGVMMLAPLIAGSLAEMTGSTATALQVGAGLSLLALASLGGFRVAMARRAQVS